MEATIVVMAYNRLQALERLLGTVSQAAYPAGEQVRLVISVDGGEGEGNQAVQEAAKRWAWQAGEKEVITRQENLGLVEHFYQCGELAKTYGAIVLLEDDLVLSRMYYHYTQEALNTYQEDERIAGISLYALGFNGYTQEEFQPLPEEADVFFLQIPYPLGQAFTKEQWEAFTRWREEKGGQPARDKVHELTLGLQGSYWTPLRTRQLADEERFYVFPKQSLVTNFGERGTHFRSQTDYFKVPLQTERLDYRMPSLDQAKAAYDNFFEMRPEKLNRLAPKLAGYDYEVDLNASKSAGNVRAGYALTRRPCRGAVMSFGTRLKPLEANVIEGREGKGIALCRREDLIYGGLAERAVKWGRVAYRKTGRATRLKTWAAERLNRMWR